MSRESSPLRDRVIFIVGARRSGTNWLERILTAHPDVVAVPTETYLFSHGVQPFTERFQHANPATGTMGRTYMPREAFLDAMRDFVDRVLLETLERQGPKARYVVERTPWHASHLPLIADVYPDARVLNIIRDGRAIARSLVAMQWGPDTLEAAAEEWRTAVADARRGGQVLGERYREVIYERLVADPRARTGEIFDWLGLELADDTWQQILLEAGAAFNDDPSSPGVRPDKWRDQLSEAELRTVERVAGAQLEELGYELAARAGGTPVVGRLRGTLDGERLRTAAGTLRRPRAAARAAQNRSFARRRHGAQIAHKAAVSRFERLVAEGDDAGAREVLAPGLWLKRDDGGGAVETRGDAAAAELIAALADHRERRIEVLSGHVHESPYAVTTVAAYELGDGSHWARTLVYHASGGRITEVGLYRYELAGGAPG